MTTSPAPPSMDFLTRLVAHARGRDTGIAPRLPSLFEPMLGWEMASEDESVAHETPAAATDPATPRPRSPEAAAERPSVDERPAMRSPTRSTAAFEIQGSDAELTRATSRRASERSAHSSIDDEGDGIATSGRARVDVARADAVSSRAAPARSPLARASTLEASSAPERVASPRSALDRAATALEPFTWLRTPATGRTLMPLAPVFDEPIAAPRKDDAERLTRPSLLSAAAPALATPVARGNREMAATADAPRRGVLVPAAADIAVGPRARPASRLDGDGATAPQATPTVHVTIGRLEIRAVQETPKAAARPTREAVRPTSLTDYLRTRGSAA